MPYISYSIRSNLASARGPGFDIRRNWLFSSSTRLHRHWRTMEGRKETLQARVILLSGHDVTMIEIARLKNEMCTFWGKILIFIHELIGALASSQLA